MPNRPHFSPVSGPILGGDEPRARDRRPPMREEATYRARRPRQREFTSCCGVRLQKFAAPRPGKNPPRGRCSKCSKEF